MNSQLTHALAEDRRRHLERNAASHVRPEPAAPRPVVRRWLSLSDLFGRPSERWSAGPDAEEWCATC